MKSKEMIQKLSVIAAFTLCPGDEIVAGIAPLLFSAGSDAIPHEAVMIENQPFKLPVETLDRRKKY